MDWKEVQRQNPNFRFVMLPESERFKGTAFHEDPVLTAMYSKRTGYFPEERRYFRIYQPDQSGDC